MSSVTAPLSVRAPSARASAGCCLGDSSSIRQATRAAPRLWVRRKACTAPYGSHSVSTLLVSAQKSCASPSLSRISGLMAGPMLESGHPAAYPEKHDPLVVAVLQPLERGVHLK